ncbi:zinc finger protein [Trypanosoma conorhini]|uniref:Zinc finger protein n=1 Tax=Trypanosoma conorhini TaxID=83891 RepID=A0A3S5IUK5_9TRYP|nr:zinc finger protein [Trypanosoma conorhini]RNF26413.1 zinc finger protein [Trypanosoma conorhini]
MTFEFQLHEPPCDLAFLAVVNGPVLYNADDATSGTVKRATIRQLGWHVVRLPEEWFFSEKSRAMTERVCHAMQCTIQYLAYRQRGLEAEVADARGRADELREERDEVFEELVALREVAARMRRRCAPNGQDGVGAEAAAPHHPLRVDSSGRSFACPLCGNGYPSSSSLESHVKKRHNRGTHYAAMTAAAAAVQNKIVKDMSLPSDTLIRELACLREEVITLREAMTVEQEKRRLETKSSFFSPVNVLAVPAQQLPGKPPGASPPSSRHQEEKLIDALQDELRDMRSRVQHMEGMMYHSTMKLGGGRGRRSGGMEEATSGEVRLAYADSSPLGLKRPPLTSFASASSAHSFNCYPPRVPATPDTMHAKDFSKEQADVVPRQTEASESKSALAAPDCRSPTFFTGTSPQLPRLNLKPSSSLSMVGDDKTSSVAELEPKRSVSPQGQEERAVLGAQGSVITKAEDTGECAAVKDNGPLEAAPFLRSDGLDPSIFNTPNIGTLSGSGCCSSQKMPMDQTDSASQVRAEETNSVTTDGHNASGGEDIDEVTEQKKQTESLFSSSRGSSGSSVLNPDRLIGFQEVPNWTPLNSYVSSPASTAQREPRDAGGSAPGFTISSYGPRSGKDVKSGIAVTVGEKQRKEEESVEEKRPAIDRKEAPLKAVSSEKSKKGKLSFFSKIFKKHKK